MLKLIFWSLLVVNGVLFAYGQGYLGKFKGNEHEPARVRNQLNADKLTLISSAQADAAAERAKIDAAIAQKKSEAIACTEVGNFSAAEARSLEKQLAPLALGEHLSRKDVPVMDVTQHVVYIPPLGSKEAADRKAAELTQLGVTNYFIMADTGISLGVFKSEAAAQTLLAGLIKQGVKSARVIGRGPTVNRVAFQFRDIDPDTKAKIEQIGVNAGKAEIRDCK